MDEDSLSSLKEKKKFSLATDQKLKRQSVISGTLEGGLKNYITKYEEGKLNEHLMDIFEMNRKTGTEIFYPFFQAVKDGKVEIIGYPKMHNGKIWNMDGEEISVIEFWEFALDLFNDKKGALLKKDELKELYLILYRLMVVLYHNLDKLLSSQQKSDFDYRFKVIVYTCIAFDLIELDQNMNFHSSCTFWNDKLQRLKDNFSKDT